MSQRVQCILSSLPSLTRVRYDADLGLQVSMSDSLRVAASIDHRTANDESASGGEHSEERNQSAGSR